MTAAPRAGTGRRSGRQAYKDLLPAMLAADERLICLDSDTGLFTSTMFGDTADRYINLGIAEHNLMGAAAGLAASGRIPFVTTMATFATTRALEAVKIDIALANLPVRIVATHGGLAAGHLGPTHHALEDFAIMRALPNMTVVAPADAAAVEATVRQCVYLPGPVYIRLGRDATPDLEAAPPPRIGQGQSLRPGTDIAIVACGPHPVQAALGAHDELARLGVSAAVLNMHTLKPLDTAALVGLASSVDVVLTVEEHFRAGGLGGAVAEVLSEHAPRRIARVGVPDRFVEVADGQPELLARSGITAVAVVARALDALGVGPGPRGGRAELPEVRKSWEETR
jgi:transketolase